jgi:hypothetical protein
VTVLRWVALATPLLGAACRAATACAAATPPVLLGSWTYTATQTSPTTANLNGTLQITSQCGSQIGGTLDVTQTDPGGGNPVRLTGVVSGVLVDTASVDFDAYLTATPRRHDATVRSDSMKSGSWFEVGGPSGSFSAVWTGP